VTDTEKIYQLLSAAIALLPPDADAESLYSKVIDAQREAAMEISEELDPESMAEVRSYKTFGDHRIVRDLVARVVEKSSESEADTAGVFYGLIDEIPTAALLQAPAETPSEMANWLIVEAERRGLASDNLAILREDIAAV
jgi:hypothetical protein